MHCIHGIQGVQKLALFSFSFFLFKFCLRMPSASSPALSRVASPNRKHVFVLLLEVRVGVAEGMGGGGGRWV